MTELGGVSVWIQQDNKNYCYYSRQMFRQHSQIDCNCSLFPRSPISTTQLAFRSPQRVDPHKENRSKKSLKCHSSSRQKQLGKPLVVGEGRKGGDMPLGSTPYVSTIASTRINFNRAEQHRNGSEINIFSAQGLPMKQSNESVGHYMSTRAASPLAPADTNTHKRITFNYHNDYDFKQHPSRVIGSPPPSQKTPCMVASNNDLRKRYLEQKSHWSKQSITSHLPPELNKLTSIEQRLPNSEGERQELQSRPRTTSNMFQLSRLTELMQQREETESIYQGERAHDEGGVEYSRVLISCRKLMEDKNGVLEQSAQTRLFDYEEMALGGFRRSGFFDHITIPK